MSCPIVGVAVSDWSSDDLRGQPRAAVEAAGGGTPGRDLPVRLRPCLLGVERGLRAHELDNLYVVHTSFFPSIGAVNPALTATADALRVGDHLLERIGTVHTGPEPAHAA